MIHPVNSEIMSKVIESEQKFLESILSSNYDRVMRILENTKQLLNVLRVDDKHIKDIEFVISKIQNNTIYNYVHPLDTEELKRKGKNNFETQNYIEIMSDFSDLGIRRNNRILKKNSSKFTKTYSDIFVREKNNYDKISLSCLSSYSGKGPFSIHGLQGKIISEDSKSYASSNECIDEEAANNKHNSIDFDKEKDLFKIPLIIINNDEEDKEKEKEKSKDKHLYIGINEINNNINSENISPINKRDDPINHNYIDTSISYFPIKEEEIQKYISEEKDNINEIDEKLLESIVSKDYNIFEFSESVGRKHTLKSIFNYIFKYSNFNDYIDTQNLDSFLGKIYEGYIKGIPFHNDLHGIDVCQTLFSWNEIGQLENLFYLSKIDLIAFYTAAVCHDFKHPGLNNNFLINQLSETALIYNDKSVLENFHLYETFKVLLMPECNIFSTMSSNNFKLIRKRMIECILATDMVCHAKVVCSLKSKLDNFLIKEGKNMDKFIDPESNSIFDDQQEIMNYLIHTADLSHNTKQFSLNKKWTDLLFEELFHQGDIEKDRNNQISFLCDRTNVQIAKSQVGFNKIIMIPTIDNLVILSPNLMFLKENLENNISEWTKLQEISLNEENKAKN